MPARGNYIKYYSSVKDWDDAKRVVEDTRRRFINKKKNLDDEKMYPYRETFIDGRFFVDDGGVFSYEEEQSEFVRKYTEDDGVEYIRIQPNRKNTVKKVYLQEDMLPSGTREALERIKATELQRRTEEFERAQADMRAAQEAASAAWRKILDSGQFTGEKWTVMEVLANEARDLDIDKRLLAEFLAQVRKNDRPLVEELANYFYECLPEFNEVINREGVEVKFR